MILGMGVITVATIVGLANSKVNTFLADRKAKHQQDIQMLQDRCYTQQVEAPNCKPLDDYLEKIK